MGITYYNSNPVPVEYTENEMKEKIQGYIAGCDGEFSFKSLCHYIVKIAIKEGKVKDAKYTQYSSNEMSPYSSIQVSKILWEMIWDRKIFIAFGENPYSAHYAGDTRFVALK